MLVARWRQALDRYRAGKLAAFLADPAFTTGIGVICGAQPRDATDRMAEQWAVAQAVLAGVELADGDTQAQVAALAALDTIDLRGGRQNAWPGGKAERDAIKDALRALRDLWRDHGEELTLALTEVDLTLAHHYPALVALFNRAARRYTTLKGERHALDFDDLEARALALLRDDDQVRAYWQAEVAALLVDEFQDTNQHQAELLALINGDAGKRFTVGDAKQSIYRFRGADVTIFRERDNEQGRTQSFSLSTSYRGHRALIEHLNALLEPVLGTEEDLNRPYVEPFAPLDHHREPPTAGLQPPFVELHLALGSKSDGALDRAAAAVVSRIVALVEEGMVVLEEASMEHGVQDRRPLDYGDIAILCRASTSFEPYENALAAAGVPFLTVAGRGFYGRPEVRDVLNALQVIADPTDDLELAGLLRSPVSGLSDMALARLVEAHAGRETPLWVTLCSRDLAFLAEERDRAEAARDLILRLHDLAGRVTVADVLKAYLDETGYRAALHRARQARCVFNLDKLLADAHASEMVSLGAFLAYVQQLRDVGVREGEARTLASGAVQLMTVHAAKGLEFPIVVIGDAARQPHRVGGPLIDPELGIVLPLKETIVESTAQGRASETEISSSIYHLVQARETDQEAAEGARLLYVAATRAREMLLISAATQGKPDGWLALLSTALHLGDGDLDAEDEIKTLDLALGEGTVRCTIYPEQSDTAPRRAATDRSGHAPSAGVTLPAAPLLMLQPLTPRKQLMDEGAVEATRDPPQRVWQVTPETGQRVSAPAWVVGQIVHGALAQWRFPADGAWRAGDDDDAFYAWAVAEARGYGITDDAEIRDALRRAERMLVRFQTTALYDRMADATRRLHEVPYHLLREDAPTDGGVMETGVIDALFESEGGWTLVEFKTDAVAGPGALKALLAEEDYVDQVARYAAAVERLLGIRPEPVLCFLNYAGAVHLVTGQW